MEKVDIVDEKLKILYSTTKRDAHEKGLLHKTVIAEIINSKGEWLLVKQAGHKQDAGQFVSPVGGHVSSKEMDEEALKREAFEEIGLKDFFYKKIGQIIYKRKIIKRNENHYFIVYEINCDQKVVLNDESVDYKWFTVAEIKKLLKINQHFFGDAFLIVIKTFYQKYFN